jgi:hypothetical protein
MIFNANEETVVKLYVAAFLRAPEKSGFQYWVNQLNQGVSARDMANTMFSLPGVQAIYPANTPATATTPGYSNTDFVSAIYTNVFGKTADATGLAFWAGRLDGGQSRGEMVLEMINLGLTLPKTTSGYSYLSNRIWTAEHAVSRQISENVEISPAQLAGALAPVGGGTTGLTGFFNVIDDLVFTAAGKPGVIYSTTTLAEASTNDGSVITPITITLPSTQDSFKGAIGNKIGTISNVPAGLAGSIVKTSEQTASLIFTGRAEKHSFVDSVPDITIKFNASDFVNGGNGLAFGLERADIRINFSDSGKYLLNGALLTGQGALPSSIDLSLTGTRKFVVDGADATIGNGVLSTVTQVNFSGMSMPANGTRPSISFEGDIPLSAAATTGSGQTYFASAAGDSIRGGLGNDTLYAGKGQDRFIFEGSAVQNGSDTIFDFRLGAGGDVLDFSAFLKVTDSSNLTVRTLDSTGTVAWNNGDVLILTGNNAGAPLTATEIAAAFGSGKAFAAPTAANKAVIIVSDIVGNATVWFLTNQTAPTVVAATELTQVATLVGINSLDMVPLVAANLA